MKYQTKAQVIAAAQATGSTATTWHGARRWMLSHVVPALIDARPRTWRSSGYVPRVGGQTRCQYLRSSWIARIESRLERAALALGIWSMKDAEDLAASLTAPYLTHAMVDASVNWPYRRSTSSWAGGEHSVTVRLGDVQPAWNLEAHRHDMIVATGARCESSKVWSSNGKWSGSNSDAVITTDLPTLLEFPTLRTRDGLMLCRARKIGTREYEVRWIEQSTGVSLKTVDGYLIRGYHVRAVCVERARKKAAKARTLAVAATIRERQAKLTKRAGLAALRGIYLSVEDSIAAGNCSSSTQQFAKRVWNELGASGPCAVRADLVISTRDDYYTRRALGAALARNRQEAA